MADQTLTGQQIASAESAAMSAVMSAESTMQAAAELELGGAGCLIRRPFDPAAHELDPTFRLTKYADLKGWGCKIPQETLLRLLEGIQDDPSIAQLEDAQSLHYGVPKLGK